MVSRCVRDAEAAGSNPVISTNEKNCRIDFSAGFCYNMIKINSRVLTLKKILALFFVLLLVSVSCDNNGRVQNQTVDSDAGTALSDSSPAVVINLENGIWKDAKKFIDSFEEIQQRYNNNEQYHLFRGDPELTAINYIDYEDGIRELFSQYTRSRPILTKADDKEYVTYYFNNSAELTFELYHPLPKETKPIWAVNRFKYTILEQSEIPNNINIPIQAVKNANFEGDDIPYHVSYGKNIHCTYDKYGYFDVKIIRPTKDLKYFAKFDSINTPGYDMKYSEDFFAKKSIIFVRIVDGSGTPQYEVKNIKINNNELFVEFTVVSPKKGACDMAEWRFLIEINKSDVDGMQKLSYDFAKVIL